MSEENIPLETQKTNVSQAQLWNVPNILTMARVVLSIVIFAIMPFQCYATCLALFIIASITDFVDGWWARKYNQKTQFGRIMDPFADKMLVCGTFIYLATIPSLHNLFPSESCSACRVPIGLATWMVVAIVMRELFVTMLRSMVEASGGDFSAKWVGKWKTTLQCVDIPLAFVILILAQHGVAAPTWLRALFVVGLYAVVYLTLYSGWIYIVAAVKMKKD